MTDTKDIFCDKILNFKQGDILLINNKPFVLIDNNSDKGCIFVAHLNSYVMIETFHDMNYSVVDSGYEYVSPDELFIKLGHIELSKC